MSSLSLSFFLRLFLEKTNKQKKPVAVGNMLLHAFVLFCLIEVNEASSCFTCYLFSLKKNLMAFLTINCLSYMSHYIYIYKCLKPVKNGKLYRYTDIGKYFTSLLHLWITQKSAKMSQVS